MNDRGQYGIPLYGGSLYSNSPWGGAPDPTFSGWPYRGPQAFHGHEAPTFGRQGAWPPRRGAPLGRGGLISGENDRGQYGKDRVGSVVSDAVDWYSKPRGIDVSPEEESAARAAADQAVAPLVEQRTALLRSWHPDAALTNTQMAEIVKQVLIPARECEKALVSLIDKVPSHWESLLRGRLTSLRASLAEAPKFEALIAKTVPHDASVVVPGFRTWINQLLSRTEDGIMAMAHVGHIQADWIRMRELVSKLYGLAVGAIHGIIQAVIALGCGALKIVEKLPTIAKVLGIGVLVAGGLWVTSKVVK